MAYPYGYNPYGYNPQQTFMPQQQTMQPQQMQAPQMAQAFACHGVTSREEAVAAQHVTVEEFEKFQKELSRRFGGKIKGEVVEEYE